MAKKPWEVAPEYNEDRFDDDHDEASHDPPDEAHFTSADDTPVDYERGPHDLVLGVDDAPSADSLDYNNGPSDSEFGLDDSDELDDEDIDDDIDDSDLIDADL